VLRPYQIEAVFGLRQCYASGNRAVLLQLATAAEKTIIFGAITHSAWSGGRRVLIVVHRRELVQQTCGKARTWQALLAAYPRARVLGTSATPARLDGKGLGSHCGGCFDAICCGPPITELIRDGYLSRARYFIPQLQADLTGVRVRAEEDYVAADLAGRVDRKAITGDAVAKYGELAEHRPAIAFCATVAHAEHVAEQFREAGYRAASVDGKTGRKDRDRLIAGLGNGEIEVLTSCDLISEGLDVPALGAVILLRPTKSLALHLQQIGRGMRPAPGKDALIVLDHLGNIRRHGRPDFERTWTLDGIDKPIGAAPLRTSVMRQTRSAQPNARFAGSSFRQAAAVAERLMSSLACWPNSRPMNCSKFSA